MLDANALHGNTAGEINALTEKAVPVNGDLLIVEDSAAGNAKKKVQLGNLPGGAGGLGYALSFLSSTHAPADANTYYIGQLPIVPTTVSKLRRVYVPKDGTITAAAIWVMAYNVVGTAENWSIYIRVNDTTDTLIATVGLAAASRLFSNTALAIAVVAGDYLEIKSVSPTWVTNPTDVAYMGHLYVE